MIGENTYSKEIYQREYDKCRNWADWELKNTIKALSLGVSSFLNTEEDWARLDACKNVLKERKQPLSHCR